MAIKYDINQVIMANHLQPVQNDDLINILRQPSVTIKINITIGGQSLCSTGNSPNLKWAMIAMFDY